MEYLKSKRIQKKISKIGLGTQPFGSHSEKEGKETIKKAFEQNINFLDTAWIYGHGKSEEIIGKTLKDYDRENIVIETKIGLQILDDTTVRDSREKMLRKQLQTSLNRLQTDYVDICYIHWPDPKIPFEKTAKVLEQFKEEGHILSVGLSNYTIDQVKKHQQKGTLSAVQNPYNIFERAIEKKLVSYVKQKDIFLMAYRPLCQGLLTGKYNETMHFTEHEVKKDDPKFKQPQFSQYLQAVEKLDKLASETFDRTVMDLAVRWILDNRNMIALWGAWKPAYLEEIEGCFEWKIDKNTRDEIDNILHETIKDPVGPEFLAPDIRTDELSLPVS